MTNELKDKELKNVKIPKKVHFLMKGAISDIALKTGTELTIQEFLEAAIKEKIANSQILNQN